jgi:hypothetical protein
MWESVKGAKYLIIGRKDYCRENWLTYMNRMDNNRAPKFSLCYKPDRFRDVEIPLKRWESEQI